MIRRPGPATMVMAGRSAGVAASLLVPIVLARLFDPSEFGTYKQVFLVYGTLFGIAQIGMAESLFYFLPADPERAGRHGANAAATLAVSGLMCAAGLWAVSTPLAAGLRNPVLAAYLPLLGLFLSCMLAAAILEIVLMSRRRFGAAACAYAATEAARALLCVLPAWIFGGLRAVLWGAVLFGAARLGATVLLMIREFGAGFRLDRGLFRRQVAYALPFQAYVLVEIAQANYHQYAVAARFDPATFALYAVGCLQVPLVDLIAGSAGNIMMVRMGELRRGAAGAAIAAAWHAVVRKLWLALVPIVGLLLVAAPDLIRLLYTDAYLASVPIFRIWTLSFLLAALPVDGVLRAHAETRSLIGLGVLKLLVVAATVGWCLDRFGLAGAVGSMLAAATVAKVAGLDRVRRTLAVGVGRLLPWTALAGILGCGIAAALAARAILAALDGPPILRLAACGLAYAGVYAALASVLHLRGTGGRAVAWPAGAQRAPAGGEGA